MKPSFGSAYLDDNKTLIQHNTLHSFHVINWGYRVGHYLKIFIINIRASINISGLVNVTVTKITLKIFIFISYHRSFYLCRLHIQKALLLICLSHPLKKGMANPLLKKKVIHKNSPAGLVKFFLNIEPCKCVGVKKKSFQRVGCCVQMIGIGICTHYNTKYGYWMGKSIAMKKLSIILYRL